MIQVPLEITCNMVSKVICVWLFAFVATIDSAEDVKRDKRTVGLLLRGAADLLGYDVVRRITDPSLRQASTTTLRPTFFPPPVAPQLPSGTYSRIILALGQQQQQQQQQFQQQLQQSFQVPPLLSTQQAQRQQQPSPQQQQEVLNIPPSGTLTASAQSISFPAGALFPVIHLPAAPVAQVPLISSVQTASQHVIPVAPLVIQTASQQAPSGQQQAAPVAPAQQQSVSAAPAQQQSAPVAPAQPQVASVAAAQAQVVPVAPSQQQATPIVAAPQQAGPTPQQSVPVAPVAPASAQQNVPAVPAAPQSSTSQQSSAPERQNNTPFGIPLQIVAIAPSQSFPQAAAQPQNAAQNASQQQNAPQSAQPQPQPPQEGSQTPPSPAPATGTDSQPSQPQAPSSGLSIVLDQGPTRWNLFSLPRQESVRRTLNFNLNWNRNVEPVTPAQFQLVPVPLEATPTPPLQAQQAPPTQAPIPPQSPTQQMPIQQEQQQQLQQQQLPAPTPTIENFDINPTQNTNSAFNRYYNIPDNFQARTAAQLQNDDNVRFRDSVTQFWESSPWGRRNNERANVQEEPRPRFEEYNLENNAEELNAPESEQYREENNDVAGPAEESDRREAYNDGNEDNKIRGRRFRLNSDRFDEETKETSDTPKFRRRNKIRRIRKVKKSANDNDETKSKVHQIFKREENLSVDDIKNHYKKFIVSVSAPNNN